MKTSSIVAQGDKVVLNTQDGQALRGWFLVADAWGVWLDFGPEGEGRTMFPWGSVFSLELEWDSEDD